MIIDQVSVDETGLVVRAQILSALLFTYELVRANNKYECMDVRNTAGNTAERLRFLGWGNAPYVRI